MQTWQCVYLHGFLSNATSQKARWFKARFEAPLRCQNSVRQIELLAPSYPQATPDESAAFLQDFIQQTRKQADRQRLFLVGSSLGGFYAQYLGQHYGIPYVLINPALDPAGLLQDYLGVHENPYTQEKISVDEAYRMQLNAYYIAPTPEIKTLLLLDKGDEVIDYRHALALYQTGQEPTQYQQHQQTRVFAGGDHTFCHLDEAWQAIQQWICAL